MAIRKRKWKTDQGVKTANNDLFAKYGKPEIAPAETALTE
jgi:hypothetical protein